MTRLAAVLGGIAGDGAAPSIPAELARNTPFLEQAVFNQHHAEHEMLRYLKRLEEKDIALNRSMIPLGSCTMKLNASAEMIPITLPGFAEIHPFAPPDQTQGYAELIARLTDWLKAITGFAAITLAAERRLAGRVFRPAGDPRLARVPRRGAPHDLPDPVQRARHQSRRVPRWRDCRWWWSAATATATSTWPTCAPRRTSMPPSWRR